MNDIPSDKKPPLDVILAMVKNKNIDVAKSLCKQFNLNYQHPELLACGVSTLPQITVTWLKKFITQDTEMLELKRQTSILATHDYSVLIQGESGTGKELLARALMGDRKGNFVALNCAGMPEHLIESELFGHVAGAFTDAKQPKLGLMRHAENGVLFLDEIGDLDSKVQAKFLRALQERVVRPVGSNVDHSINCRIVCATHWNLWELVQSKKFRLDLYARISTFKLQTKPLRERQKDIFEIIKTLPQCTPEVLVKLVPLITSYLGRTRDINDIILPLNVRDLEAIVARYVVLGVEP